MHLRGRLNENQGTNKACNNVLWQAGYKTGQTVLHLRTACSIFLVFFQGSGKISSCPRYSELERTFCPINNRQVTVPGVKSGWKQVSFMRLLVWAHVCIIPQWLPAAGNLIQSLQKHNLGEWNWDSDSTGANVTWWSTGILIAESIHKVWRLKVSAHYQMPSGIKGPVCVAMETFFFYFFYFTLTCQIVRVHLHQTADGCITSLRQNKVIHIREV